MTTLAVGVVFGGRSVEHDVSIVTAHQVMAVLAGRHEVVPIYVTREGQWLTSPGLNDLDVYRREAWNEVGEGAFIPPSAGYGGLYVPGGRLRGARRIALDVVIPAIHGTFGEDGTLQGLLELADIPYTGSGVVGSAVGMDKVAMKAAFAAAGVPVVRHAALTLPGPAEPLADDLVATAEREIGYPAFVKPARLGSSVGIGKARDRDSLREVLDVARRYDRRVLVEEAMEGFIEVNCAVLGGGAREPRASVCEQPVSWEEFLSFSDKYLRRAKGGKAGDGMAAQERRIPAPISDELTRSVQETAVRAFRSVDAAGVARVDCFVREATGEIIVMEINTVPGSFAFYLWEATGVTFTELMDELIEIALEVHRARRDLMFTYESGMLRGPSGVKVGG